MFYSVNYIGNGESVFGVCNVVVIEKFNEFDYLFSSLLYFLVSDDIYLLCW